MTTVSYPHEGPHYFAGSHGFELEGGPNHLYVAASDEQDAVPDEETEPSAPAPWTVAEGRFDETVAASIDLSLLSEASDSHQPEDRLQRFMAARAVVYGAGLTSPERFTDPEQADAIQNTILQMAPYCSYLEADQHRKLEVLTADLVSPLLEAIDEMTAQGLDQASSGLAKSITRTLYLRQTGRDSEIPHAWVNQEKRAALPAYVLPRLQN